MPTLNPGFEFVVIKSSNELKQRINVCVLIENDWDDWFRYNTTYKFIIFDVEGVMHEIGLIKVGQKDMQQGQTRPIVPPSFNKLKDMFFSLGQSDTYYENLNKFGSDQSRKILIALRDIAYDLRIWKKVRELPVTDSSLLRSVTASSVEGQFHRIARGDARLTKYRFSYSYPKRVSPHRETELTFKVIPNSYPPTNLHVLIGRNGCGKTMLLNLLVKSIIGSPKEKAQSGEFVLRQTLGNSGIASVVFVSFSAFDNSELYKEGKSEHNSIEYKYIGLKRLDKTAPGRGKGTPKSTDMLAKEFSASLFKNRNEPSRAKRWSAAIKSLESDPIFKERDLGRLINEVEGDEKTSLKTKVSNSKIRKEFKDLSSGHQIVLLSLTRLIESVEEKSLVLIDEPEAHLHPPLLSAFTRALSNLMIDRNGVSVIATHSPVILQEIPQSCVWIIDRTGDITNVERPEFETFGENLGLLTRGVFKYEVTDSGFHKMLKDAADEEDSFEDAIDRFGGQLGGEARSILRVHFLRKNKR